MTIYLSLVGNLVFKIALWYYGTMIYLKTPSLHSWTFFIFVFSVQMK